MDVAVATAMNLRVTASALCSPPAASWPTARPRETPCTCAGTGMDC